MSIKETIVAIVAEYKNVDPAEIKTDVPFRELGLDSLDVAELLLKIEEELRVMLEPSPKYDSIDKLAAYIAEQA